MKIAKKYSHLNGEEWLLVHEKDTYQEIIDVIQAIDAEKCRTKISKEKTRKGKYLDEVLMEIWLGDDGSIFPEDAQ